ncbi:MAG: tRNA (N6-threonylcarbamoyladenosine(37)-N6)-methyltransferase TrmO [Syntrophobacterales bacterium]|nr:tRNA (N6-threonylcarbamoyladenosine(37)-N6)-methyltransferase TrmO [Syntrophobacterales bacterium]
MIELKPIGYVRVSQANIPRHWSISDIEGELVIEPIYTRGLEDIRSGDRIVVLFHFHKSPPFDVERHLKQKPPHRNEWLGVFSICSPIRPNPIGLSILEVICLEGNIIKVKGLDMFDETPILDIKPYIAYEVHDKKQT